MQAEIATLLQNFLYRLHRFGLPTVPAQAECSLGVLCVDPALGVHPPPCPQVRGAMTQHRSVGSCTMSCSCPCSGIAVKGNSGACETGLWPGSQSPGCQGVVRTCWDQATEPPMCDKSSLLPGVLSGLGTLLCQSATQAIPLLKSGDFNF